MFSIFKSRPTLRELIPADHIDFHSHVLPGIDDGAKTAEHTLALVESLREMGCSQLIATPHIMHSVWDNSPANILEKRDETRALLKQAGIDIKIEAAAEYLMDSFFVQRLKSEKLLCVHDNFVLVEMSYINPPIQLYDILFEMQLEGYIPILAHPERYAFYHNKAKEYQKLKDAGCRFQLNLLSCIGYYGKDVANAAERLLETGLVDFAGSDVHHSRHVEAFSKKLVVKSHKALSKALENNQQFRF
ncbi:histidinol phosphatase [Flavobacterium sp. D33]|nr:CpsB/CapC family capsule biosynthesis tyrosine phosphatase [Flavobacterium selenitireducens]MBD3583445.1 histidinol phosphatase [Flavobacterium selenitireducens]